ncbi:ABC transporter ATP-binding protein [Paracoccus aestuarii]|uniref:ABC transporter ATP-binding protein n=2 Tax=Paracoccus aestuarii TaxID=453842 RepID=A0A418ZYB5_9RHOB|nr:ABC transporter ATP-binding protein [Paracoccus aestuarii]
MEIGEREILGLIGPNGAGKTTLFNCLSRLYRHCSGDITVRGENVNMLGPEDMVSRGVGRTFQNIALFESMTVFENVMTGAQFALDCGLVADIFRPGRVRRERAETRDRIMHLLSLLDLADIAHHAISDQNFGVRKRIEFARALAANPALLMLDEPAGGLNREEVAHLMDLIRQVRDEFDVAILLVEHHLNLVMKVSDRVVAMDFGRKIADGRPDEVRSHPEVLRAYLGEESV